MSVKPLKVLVEDSIFTKTGPKKSEIPKLKGFVHKTIFLKKLR